MMGDAAAAAVEEEAGGCFISSLDLRGRGGLPSGAMLPVSRVVSGRMCSSICLLLHTVC